MNSAVKTILGLAVIAGAAILVGRMFMGPAQEEAERRDQVLSGAYEERVVHCRFLEDSELPEGLQPPEVGENLAYLEVAVLYPDAARTPATAKQHRLIEVNGVPDANLEPVHAASESTEDGITHYMVYRTDNTFEVAQLVRPGKVISDRLLLD